MISAVGIPAVNHPIHVPSASPSQDTSPTQVGLASTTRFSSRADVLSLSQPDSGASGDGVYQRTSLKIRSHSQVKVTDDGETRAMSQTKLRFRYDFEAADGSKIQVRVQANMRYSQVTDSDQESQSLKLRATARVYVLQQNVSSGISPLLNTPETSGDAKNVISQALEFFAQATDAASSAFLNNDPLDGDSLITGVVEAFNGLSDAINAIFLPPAAPPQTLPSGEVAELPELPTPDPIEVLPTAPAPVESAPPVDGQSIPVSEAPAQDTTPSDVPPEAGESGGTDVVQDVEPTPTEPTPTEPTTNEPTPTEPSRPTAGSVMVKLRLQVIQSLNSLVDAFDSDSSSLIASQSVFRASAQFSAHYTSTGSIANDSLSGSSSIDAQV